MSNKINLEHIEQANKLLDEHDVPEEDRSAWLTSDQLNSIIKEIRSEPYLIGTRGSVPEYVEDGRHWEIKWIDKKSNYTLTEMEVLK